MMPSMHEFFDWIETVYGLPKRCWTSEIREQMLAEYFIEYGYI